MMDEHPFEVVEKSERRSPFQGLTPTKCTHDRVFETGKYPPEGVRYVCVDCGFGSVFPRAFKTHE